MIRVVTNYVSSRRALLLGAELLMFMFAAYLGIVLQAPLVQVSVLPAFVGTEVTGFALAMLFIAAGLGAYKLDLWERITKRKRKEGRESKVLPVKVFGDNVKGVTRDLSASGVFFEISSYYEVGSSIKMTIEIDGPHGMQLECEGTIVRAVGHGSDKMRVAVRMDPLRSRLTQSPENRVNQDFDALNSREHALNLNDQPTRGVIRCANPRSPHFGQCAGKCEFSSLPACDHARRDFDEEFGCKFALLNVPAKVPVPATPGRTPRASAAAGDPRPTVAISESGPSR